MFSNARRILLRIIAMSLGGVFLAYGLIAIPTGLFVRADIFIVGLISICFAFVFLANSMRETLEPRDIVRLLVGSTSLLCVSLALATSSWFVSEQAPFIIWCVMAIASSILCYLAQIELRIAKRR